MLAMLCWGWTLCSQLPNDPPVSPHLCDSGCITLAYSYLPFPAGCHSTTCCTKCWELFTDYIPFLLKEQIYRPPVDLRHPHAGHRRKHWLLYKYWLVYKTHYFIRGSSSTNKPTIVLFGFVCFFTEALIILNYKALATLWPTFPFSAPAFILLHRELCHQTIPVSMGTLLAEEERDQKVQLKLLHGAAHI